MFRAFTEMVRRAKLYKADLSGSSIFFALSAKEFTSSFGQVHHVIFDVVEKPRALGVPWCTVLAIFARKRSALEGT